MSILNQETMSRTITYTYDPLGRLTAAEYLAGDYFHYTYDAVGTTVSYCVKRIVTKFSNPDKISPNSIIGAGKK